MSIWKIKKKVDQQWVFAYDYILLDILKFNILSIKDRKKGT